MDIILKLMGVHRAEGVGTSTPNYNLYNIVHELCDITYVPWPPAAEVSFVSFVLP